MEIQQKPSKLTEWENEPSLSTLKKDFQASKQYHDSQVTKIKHWKNLLNVEGPEKPKEVKGHSKVQPKLIRRQAEWRYSALSEPFLGSDRVFRVSPRTFEDVESARQNELLLNYQFDNKLNKVKFVDEYVRATVDEGTSVIRVGWTRVTKPTIEVAPVYEYYPITDESQMQILQQAAQMKQDNIRAFKEQVPKEIQESLKFMEENPDGQPVMAVMVDQQEVESEVILENHPDVELINPANIFIDPSCQGDIDKAMFAIVSFETNKAELQKTGLYSNLDKVDWEGNSPTSDSDHESPTPPEFSYALEDNLRKRVVAYEYWGSYDINKTGELVPIVATWIGDTLIRMAENPFPDGKLPFVFVPYLPIKRSIYGEPDAELLADNQRILGAVSRGIIDLLGKSANSQQGFAKGFLDPVNKRRFESGQDYEFNPTNGPVQGNWIMHTFPEIPQSALAMLEIQNNEAEAITGVKNFGGGISGEAYGQVAAGIQGVLDASSKREMAILRRLSKGLCDIGNKIIAMNSVFLSDEEVIRVTNQQFITIKREEIKGNFDLLIDISTAEVDNAKAQDMGFMIQTIGPTIDPTITTTIMADIADLKRMPDLADKLRKWKPQPDPLEEEKKRLEIVKLQAEIQLAQARAQKQTADAEAKSVDTELTATGVKHNQDMERMQAQAQGNQDLEVTKAMLKPRKMDDTKPNIDGAVGFNILGGIMRKGAKQALDNVTHRQPNELNRLSQANNQLNNQEIAPTPANSSTIDYVPPYQAR